MTRIIFLHGVPDRFAAAARWAAEAWGVRRPVMIFAPQSDAAERIDRVLWTQGATGFVPHCRADSPLATETSILIATQLDAIAHDRCLINLGNEIPPGFSRFEELIEIISTDEAVRLPARERFKFYRERGYAPESRNLADN